MVLILGFEFECRVLDERDLYMFGKIFLEEVNIIYRFKLFIGR